MKTQLQSDNQNNEMQQLTCVSFAKFLEPTILLLDSALNTNANAAQASMFGKF